MTKEDRTLLHQLFTLHTHLDKRGLTLVDALPELIRLAHKAASESGTTDGMEQARAMVNLAEPPSDEPGKLPNAWEHLTLEQQQLLLKIMLHWIQWYIGEVQRRLERARSGGWER